MCNGHTPGSRVSVSSAGSQLVSDNACHGQRLCSADESPGSGCEAVAGTEEERFPEETSSRSTSGRRSLLLGSFLRPPPPTHAHACTHRCTPILTTTRTHVCTLTSDTRAPTHAHARSPI